MKNYGLTANKYIKEYSEKRGICIANAADYFNGPLFSHPAKDLLFLDKVHPNENGHIKIFEALKELNV